MLFLTAVKCFAIWKPFKLMALWHKVVSKDCIFAFYSLCSVSNQNATFSRCLLVALPSHCCHSELVVVQSHEKMKYVPTFTGLSYYISEWACQNENYSLPLSDNRCNLCTSLKEAETLYLRDFLWFLSSCVFRTCPQPFRYLQPTPSFQYMGGRTCWLRCYNAGYTSQLSLFNVYAD